MSTLEDGLKGPLQATPLNADYVDWYRSTPEGLLRYPIVSSMSCAWFASLHADLAAIAADATRRSAHFHFAHYETVTAS